MITEEMIKEHMMGAFYIIAHDCMPSILRELLNQKRIDPEKRYDPSYLWNEVLNNKNIFADFKVATQIHDEFIEVAEYAIENNKPLVAITLLATAVEHLLNLYYGEW